MRRECFKKEIKLVVVKNNLLKKALENVEGDFSPLQVAMKGNTAVMFSQTANAPARLIKEFTKDAKKDAPAKPALKAAYVQESFYVGAENLEALVNIKSKTNLSEMLSCCCNLRRRTLFLLFSHQDKLSVVC